MTEKGFDAKIIAEILEEPLAFVKKIQQQLTKKEEIRRQLKMQGADPEKVAKKLCVLPSVVAFFNTASFQ